MSRRIWIAVAVVAAVVVAWLVADALLLLFLGPPKVDIVGSCPCETSTKSAAMPPFTASSYEVNYTIAFTVSLGGVMLTMDGWVVVAAYIRELCRPAVEALPISPYTAAGAAAVATTAAFALKKRRK